jgi:general stress protein 26
MRNMDMTDDQVDSFLHEHKLLRLATVSENGWPHVVPVAYTRLDGDEIYVLTHPGQRKSQNIGHNNKVALVVDEGTPPDYFSMKGVFIHGYATQVADSLVDDIERSFVDKCYEGEIPELVKIIYSMRDGWVWFEIDPANTVSWDNSNIDESRLEGKDVPSGMPFQYGESL